MGPQMLIKIVFKVCIIYVTNVLETLIIKLINLLPSLIMLL